MADDISELMQRAIEEAKRISKEADSGLPLSERDKQLYHTPVSEYMRISDEQAARAKEDAPPPARERSSIGSLLSGIFGASDTSDLLLYAVAFMLLKDNTDNELLLALLYIILGK